LANETRIAKNRINHQTDAQVWVRVFEREIKISYPDSTRNLILM
jgi:hypothetical protein